MSAVKSSLRSLVLTPERIPDFLIPSRSPLRFLSPRPHRISPDRTRLLSDHDDDSPGPSPPVTPSSPATSNRFLLRLPSPRIRRPPHTVTTPAGAESADADTDLTTRAAMSLSHVGKVTTPYGFRAVLAASPCTRRRESLFHHNRPVTVTVTDADLQGQQDSENPAAGPGPSRSRAEPGPGPSRSRAEPGPGPSRSPVVSLRPVKALGLQMMKELKKPAAALKSLSPAARKRAHPQ